MRCFVPLLLWCASLAVAQVLLELNSVTVDSTGGFAPQASLTVKFSGCGALRIVNTIAEEVQVTIDGGPWASIPASSKSNYTCLPASVLDAPGPVELRLASQGEVWTGTFKFARPYLFCLDIEADDSGSLSGIVAVDLATVWFNYGTPQDAPTDKNWIGILSTLSATVTVPFIPAGVNLTLGTVVRINATWRDPASSAVLPLPGNLQDFALQPYYDYLAPNSGDVGTTITVSGQFLPNVSHWCALSCAPPQCSQTLHFTTSPENSTDSTTACVVPAEVGSYGISYGATLVLKQLLREGVPLALGQSEPLKFVFTPSHRPPPPPTPPTPSNNGGAIAGGIIGTLAFGAIVVGGVHYYRRRAYTAVVDGNRSLRLQPS
eukprot:TRINITY_DN13978_c0_g1_i1.p1 TRINITY_DN13978_c0_g1~~TRINITY_DN13978_c0_g1_i1.p1  ORF type:complete len:376 (-),score=54.21 TRINITY_DN13978_c0_g1_i1:52-1179(-)